MASEFERRLLARALLQRFPAFMQTALVEEDAFAQSVGLRLGATLTVGDGEAVFERDAFFAGCSALYAGPDAEVDVKDASDLAWRMTFLGVEDDRTVVSLAHDERRLRLLVPPGLNPDRGARLREFDAALSDARLPAEDLASWREILSDRVLDGDEVGAIEASLRHTPVFVERALRRALRNDFGLGDLVPEALDYWERLVGPGAATDLPSLASQVANHVSKLRELGGIEAARHALLLAGHSSLTDALELHALPRADIEALATWAAESGDVIAKLAMVEVGLAAGRPLTDLAPILERLIKQILELDPADKNGSLRLWSALFVAIDGQLSHLRIAKDWAPLQRRHAAMAQAALIARVWPASLPIESIYQWALEARGSRFYLQTLVDLHEEPRWIPDFASPEQWKNEFIGRLVNASGLHAQSIADTALAPLLTGGNPGSVIAELNFPGAFFPGPLEGAVGAARPLPPPFEEIVEAALSVERLELKSLAALINMRGLFTIGEANIARATQLIEDAGYRLPADSNPQDAEGVLKGLAGVASASRSAALAEKVRVMARRRRTEGATPSPLHEVSLALTCAAVHEDRRLWARAAGDWIGEIAFNTTDRSFAQETLVALETLSYISPFLRGGLGPSIVALRSFLSI